MLIIKFLLFKTADDHPDSVGGELRREEQAELLAADELVLLQNLEKLVIGDVLAVRQGQGHDARAAGEDRL